MTDSEMLKLILDKVDNVDTKVSCLESDMQEVKQDISVLKSDVSELKADMQEVKQDISVLKSEVSVLKSDMQKLNEKVIKIDLTLENEIRVNIKRVAEGHLDLSRNLHDAMKPNNEIEMLAVKVRVLEADVEELKQKIS